MEVSIKKIKESLPAEKNKIDKLDLWVFYFIRPISYYFTWVFVKAKFTPTMATALSMIVGIIGEIVIIPNGRFFHLFGALVINLWIVLDCVDGNIARFKKQTSIFGEFLDGLSGYLFTGFLYTCLGMSVFFSDQSISIFESQKWIYILIGCLTSFVTIFPRLIDHKARTLFFEYQSKTTDKNEYNIFKIIGLNIAGMAGLCNPLLFIAAMTNFLNLYLLFYFFVHSLIAIYSISSTIKSVPKNI